MFSASKYLEGKSYARKKSMNVITFLCQRRISPQAFGENILGLFQDKIRSYGLSAKYASLKFSPSIYILNDPPKRPSFVPLWMLAAFPDVVVWFLTMIEKYDTKPESEELPNEIWEIYGIDPSEVDQIPTGTVFNVDGQMRVKYFSNLVENYLKKSGKPLEVSVLEGSANDIYLGHQILDALGATDNFSLIARMTTMAYIHLKKEYLKRFPNENAVITTAGVLDADIYIHVTKEMTVQQVIDIGIEANKSLSMLLDFIIGLETLMLSIDSPQYTKDEVLKAVQGQAKLIAEVIETTIRKDSVDPNIAFLVDQFMRRWRDRRTRKRLNIADK